MAIIWWPCVRKIISFVLTFMCSSRDACTMCAYNTFLRWCVIMIINVYYNSLVRGEFWCACKLCVDSRQSTVTWLLCLSTINVILAVPFAICWLHRPRQSSSNGERRKCVYMFGWYIVLVPVLISATETNGNDRQRFKSVRPFTALIYRIWRVRRARN